jgi:hypoxanthine phosphoribosyltransferase
MKYIYVSWSEAIKLTIELAGEIISSNYLPNSIVAISRGGLIPARVLSDIINVDEVYSIKASLWGVGGKVFDRVVIQEVELPIKGKKVLIVDDVVDSGSTLDTVVRRIKVFNPEEVRTAVLHIKPTSKYIPDYYVSRLESWAWIIYPWTIHEVIYSLMYKEYGCKLLHMSPEDIIKVFQELTNVVTNDITASSINLAKEYYLKPLCKE